MADRVVCGWPPGAWREYGTRNGRRERIVVRVPAGPPARHGEDDVTGVTDDSRPGRDALPGRGEGVIPVGLCPGCGRSTADDVCLHCAAEDHFRSASLVRTFVIFPDRYARDTPLGSSPGPGPGDRSTSEEHPPAPVPTRTQARAVGPAATGVDAAPGRVRAAARRRPLDPSGWGILPNVAIAGGAILLATVVGIVGAVVSGPGDAGGPGVAASPGGGQPPGGPRPPAGGGNDRSG
ncbi:hypothetical protein C1I99_17305, partial [Micromonospora deserti]